MAPFIHMNDNRRAVLVWDKQVLRLVEATTRVQAEIDGLSDEDLELNFNALVRDVSVSPPGHPNELVLELYRVERGLRHEGFPDGEAS